MFLGFTRMRGVTALAFQLEIDQVLEAPPLRIAYAIQVLHVREVHEQARHVDRQFRITRTDLLEARFCKIAQQMTEWMTFRDGHWS
jgi:hypothetical protein